MSANYPPTMPTQPIGGPQPPPGKKTSPLIWILGGCAGILVIGTVVVVIVVMYAAHKAKEMARHPGMTAARLAASMNPDVQIVSEDDDKGTITLRDKKSGETTTINVDQMNGGNISFQKNGKDAASIQFHQDGKSGSGSVDIKTDDGTVKFGTNVGGTPPPWVPKYPGSDPKMNAFSETRQGLAGSYQFTTSDDAGRVVDFFVNEAKDAGLSQSGKYTSGSTTMATLSDDAKKRNLIVTAVSESGHTTVNVQFQAQP